MPFCSSVAGDDGKIHVSLEKNQIARQWINGSFLPLVVEFQTQFPNGLILYTHSESTGVSGLWEASICIDSFLSGLMHLSVGAEFIFSLPGPGEN